MYVCIDGVQVAEEMSLPQREESSAVADGREQIQPLPRSNVMGLVEEVIIRSYND